MLQNCNFWSLNTKRTLYAQNNFYSQMLQMKKPDGNLLFNVLTVEMICAVCKEAGKFDCKHVNKLPPWKTSERQDLVKTLMANDAVSN